jgi:hypothetical protein
VNFRSHRTLSAGSFIVNQLCARARAATRGGPS